MSRAGLPGAVRNPTNIGRHQLLVMQRSKRCVQVHSSPDRERYLASVAVSSKLIAPVATGVVRQSSFSLNLVCRTQSRFSRMRRCARLEGAPSRCDHEQGDRTMATQYFARPKVQVFGVSTAFVVRKIGLSDLTDALRLGWEDFKAIPTHAVVLCVIYPVLGLVLFRLVVGYSVLPLLFPLAAGFTLIGPFAALGLYELSRRRERGEEAAAWDAMQVLRAPSFGAMLELGTLLLVLFGTWIAVADAIYVATFGHAPAATIPDFASRVLTTPQGWSLIIIGCGVGFLFAVAALCVSVVSFPLMLDRHATAIDAIRTSLRAVRENPFAMAVWGLMVAVLLAIGSLPFFVGLAVVLPVLGHATWHLYRKLVEPDPNPSEEQPRPPIGHRYAADFPASLFPWSHER
jgi:uncharacterized membrane protein